MNGVGIGIASPGALLDVGRTLNIGELSAVMGRLNEGNNAGAGTYVGFRGFATQGPDYSNVRSFALEHSFYGQINSSINFFRGLGMTGGYLTFNTDANVEKMRITATGFVGIGTPSPQEALFVNGNIRARQIKVEIDRRPDYVFEDRYSLPSLQDLNKYVRQNHRLPNMPTAKDVESLGLNLGEITRNLMEKVEELTLYLIEKDRQLGEQEKIIKLQEGRLLKLESKL